MTLDLAGFQIGHATESEAHTGCTVILCPPETVGGLDVRGPAPGSREAALMAPDKRDILPNAVLFTGGSAFGLAAADGVMRFLAERNIGHWTPIRRIPIVPTAVVYDLFLGGGERLPDAAMGYEACERAGADDVAQGNVGAGAGVTVGKWAGPQGMMKGGFGLAGAREGDLIVNAAAVVNAVGDVLDTRGQVLAGARNHDGEWAVRANRWRFRAFDREAFPQSNTTLVAVMTNATLNKVEANRLAQRAHDGLAIAIRPIHTSHDGDTAYALATARVLAPFDLVANMAVEAVAAAIRNGVRHAAAAGDVPGLAG